MHEYQLAGLGPEVRPKMNTTQSVRLTDQALRRSVEGLLEPWLETATREELAEVNEVINRQLADRAEPEERAA